MPLSNTLRRMVEAHSEETRDPLGLDAKLQEYFLGEDPYKFNHVTRRLVLALMHGQDPRRRDPSVFHASAAGNCRRQQVIGIRYHDLLVPQEKSLDGEQRMGEGRWSHIKWQAIFSNMGLLVRAEYLVEYEPWHVMGSPDGEIRLPWLSQRDRFLLEVKSMSRYRWELAVKAGQPEMPHQYQTHTYIQATDLQDIVYLYENRDTQDWKIFYQKRDLDIVKFLRKRYRYMNYHLVEGELPKPDCTFKLSDKMYLYCPVREFCKQQLAQGR